MHKIYSSASNRIINARDHASIQINVAEVDPVRGVMTGSYKTYALCGSIRQMVNFISYIYAFNYSYIFEWEDNNYENQLKKFDS